VSVAECIHGSVAYLCIKCQPSDYNRGKADGISEERERTERQKSISADLWKLLDDIDTASDAFKTNYEGLAKYVYNTQRKRFAIMTGEEYDAIRSAKEKL
jgi:hypothetical protein